MAKYRFDEIAINSTEKKKPVEEDRYTYLGLEHLDSGSLKVTRYGTDVAPVGEKLVMHKGDVLFGKRRAYQKKVAIAPFDGIFSAHGMVLRPKEDVIDKDFFPLFISSDYFLDAAIKISVGSLSPTINWRDLKVLEFELPDLAEQRKLAQILWSMNDTIESYKKLLDSTDKLVKSQFIEMFGDPLTDPKGYPIKKLSAYTVVMTGATPNRNCDEYYGGSIPWIKTGEIEVGEIRTAEEYITEKALHETNCKLLPINTVMIAMYGQGKTRGKSGILQIEAATNQACAAILPCKNLNPIFLHQFFVNQYNRLRGLGRGAQQSNLNLSMIKNYPIIDVPLSLQEQFAAFVKQTDKSKFELEQALAELTATYKHIIRENLG